MMARISAMFTEVPSGSAIPSRSRMTRMNESHEYQCVDSCHSSIRAIRAKNVPEFTVKIPSRSQMDESHESHESNEFYREQRPEVIP